MNNTVRTLSLACALALPMLAAQPAAACGSDPMLGQVCVFGFTYCPQGFLPADGRLLQINQNQALYSLYGTNYGGDGRSTFGVPDLRGRAIVGTGVNPASGVNVQIGQMRGSEQVTLNVNQMPAHTHAAAFTAPSVTQPTVNVTVNAKQSAATVGTPAAGVQMGDTGRSFMYAASGATGNNVPMGGVTATASGTALSGGSVVNAPAGANAPVPTLPPELGMTACISIMGIYPMRP